MNTPKFPYIIAETAYSFEGSKEYLLKQTENLPPEINAIKYHMIFNINEYMDKKHSLYPLLQTWVLPETDWTEILRCAKSKKHDVIILSDDTNTVSYLENHVDMVDGIEIHAACVNDRDLFDRIIDFSVKYKKTLYIGISGFEILELFDIAFYLKAKQCEKIIFMFGFQNYPTRFNDVQLIKIPKLKQLFDVEIGYADHTGYNEPFKEQMIKTAYTLGASVQEVHYVLNEGENRTDAVTAVSAERLKRIQDDLIILHKAIDVFDLRLNEGERKYLGFRKALVYSRNLKKGHILSKEDICFIRIENSISQHKFLEESRYIGKTLKIDVLKNEEIRDCQCE